MGTVSNRLLGITAISPTNIYSFGSYFAENGSGNQMTLFLHWNGTSWTNTPSPDPTNRASFLSDILWAGAVPSPALSGLSETRMPRKLWLFTPSCHETSELVLV
jgi:hypothetical protein